MVSTYNEANWTQGALTATGRRLRLTHVAGHILSRNERVFSHIAVPVELAESNICQVVVGQVAFAAAEPSDLR